ncbi:MAG: hypothetical protein SP4CHLAM5_03920 [Chlamydiia bacterium]|nr:hypothetical protein [Chlamydiia bacterium]MCH9618265.1 hypothetical protein [Chlamydiia bacterium]
MKKALLAIFCAALSCIEATTFTVTNSTDLGPGSFRREQLSATTTGDIVQFDPANSPFSITIGYPTIGFFNTISIDINTSSIVFEAASAYGFDFFGGTGTDDNITITGDSGKLDIGLNIGTVASPRGFTKQGGSTFALSHDNTFTGGVLLEGGTFQLGGDNGMGPGELVMSAGTTLIVDNGVTGPNHISLKEAGSMTFSVGAVTPTDSASWSGLIDGPGTLVKTGSGILTLTKDTNAYTGGTLVSQGTLKLTGFINTTEPVTINGTSIFDISGVTPTTNYTIGDLASTTGSSIELGSNSFTFGASANNTVGGAINGSGSSVTKQGIGSVIFTGNSTYDGGTTITEGSLAISGGGTLNVTGAVSVTGTSSIFDISGITATNLTIGDLSTVSGSTLNLGSKSLTFGTATATTTAAGIITGTGGSIVKQGTGTTILLGENTFTGDITISGGTLTIGSNNALGNGGTLTMDPNTSLTINGGVTASNDILLPLAGERIFTAESGSGAVLSGTIEGAGSLNKEGGETLTLSGENTYSGGTTISEGTLTITGSLLDTGSVTVNGTSTFDISGVVTSLTVGSLDSVSGTTIKLGTKSLIFGTNIDNNTIAGIIAGTGGSIVKQASKSVTLSGANTFSGGTSLEEGSIILNNSTGLGSGALTMATGTNLTLNDAIAASNSISLPAAGGRIFTVSSGDTATLSGVISDQGSLEKTGGGTLTLAGTNTYSGGTTITEGTVAVTGSLSSTGSVAVNGSSSFDISGVGSALTIGDLTAAPGTEIKIGAKSLTFGTANNATIAGIISGDSGGTITKTGTGSVTLSATNTFAGTVNASQGTLVVNGVLPGDVSAANSATIKGTGSIGGKLSIASGATLTPGNSIGTITLGSLSLSAGSTTEIEFDPLSSSVINVTGAAALAGELTPVFDAGDYPLTGSYEILTASSITGTFDSISSGLPDFVFALDYTGTTVTLTYTNPIPTDGLTGNLLKFANYLNTYSTINDDFIALAALSGDALYNALNSASPARNAFPTYVSQMTAFTLSHNLSNYLDGKRFLNSYDISGEIADICMSNQNHWQSSNTYWNQSENNNAQPQYCFWIDGFVDFANGGAENQNVPFDFITGAVLVGVDFESAYKENILGIAAGYANSWVEDNRGMGSSDISSLAATIYTDYMYDILYMQGAFWAVLELTNNQRIISYPGVHAKATSNFTGWQINPHVELGVSVGNKMLDVQPYIAFDYVQNQQDGFTETGAGTFNMTQKAQKSSMLQTEVGMRFYQGVNRCYYRLGIKEKISFINRVPFDTGKVTTAIFNVDHFVTLTSFTQTQTLAAVSLSLFIQAGKEKNTIISIGYDGLFGNQYVSNGANLTISTSF